MSVRPVFSQIITVNFCLLWLNFTLSITGSLLVACSHFGAYVCGIDIDYNIIHGKGLFTLGYFFFLLVFFVN